MLDHPLFKNSRRYPSFLRYVVESALAGRMTELKERAIGIDLFGRLADYDTNADHIVRSTAAEIRKRIAQYYQEQGVSSVRIEMPAGAYVPDFRILNGEPPEEVLAHPDTAVAEPPPVKRYRLDSRTTAIVAFAVLVPLLALALWRRLDSSDGPLAVFWGDIIESNEPVILCTSPPMPSISDSDPPPTDFWQLHRSGKEHISSGDAETLARIAGFLGSVHRRFRVRTQPASFSDLRQGPIVLIGALNNEWTLRLTDQLRFRFSADDGTRRYSVVDSRHPERRDWSFDFRAPVSSQVVDYAVISRFFDQTTGRYLVIAAGIAKYGTAAAGEFLTNPETMAGFERRIPKGWRHRNVQIVLRTKVISDASGQPEVLETYFW